MGLCSGLPVDQGSLPTVFRSQGELIRFIFGSEDLSSREGCYKG